MRELKKLNFEVSKADPCLLTRQNKVGICIIILYIDDLLVIGNKASMDDLVVNMKKVFAIKTDPNLKDYLGCVFEMNKHKTKAWLGQPFVIKSLKEKFEKLVSKTQICKTPGTPGFTSVRPKEGDKCIEPEDQQTYRSGVGTLLYLTKHSRPDLSNSTRELSKVMDGATPAHMKELKRIIKYVLNTPNVRLRIEPTMDEQQWHLKALCDSDFAADKDTRISVTGYVVYFLGVPVAWKSKGMKSVVLSTTEAEYVSISEVVKEIIFIL